MISLLPVNKNKMIINHNGSINALRWTHNGKTYWFTYHNESTGKTALQHLDEIECSDGNKGMFPRARVFKLLKWEEKVYQ